MSYWPPPPEVIRLNMSFELPAYFAETLQPVCFSNGVTHCFSVYPSQATSVSLPSPCPDRRRHGGALRHARRGNGEDGHERREARRIRSEFASRFLLLDHEFHVRAPAEPDALPLHLVHVLRRRLEVLLHHRQLAASVERDDELRRRARGRRRP